MSNECKKYAISDVFSMIGEDNLATECYSKSDKSTKNQIEVDGYTVYTRSLRYMTFYQKGCKCCSCGKEGTHFTLDVSCGDNPMRKHFNLRADDGTLMTRDHIIPKSRGGREHIANMQTMCCDCNKAKGNHMDGDEDPQITILAIKSDNKDKIRGYIDENDAIFCILNDIMKVTSMTSKKKAKIGHKIKKTIEVTRTFLSCIDSGIPYCGYYWYTKGNQPI